MVLPLVYFGQDTGKLQPTAKVWNGMEHFVEKIHVCVFVCMWGGGGGGGGGGEGGGGGLFVMVKA